MTHYSEQREEDLESLNNMSDAKFTKGEWLARASESPFSHGFVYIDGGGFDVSDSPDCVANAHLIASAPDMYRALERQRAGLLNLIDLELIPQSYVNSVRHEISLIDNELAKARGRL